MKANHVHIWTARPEQVAARQWAELETLLDDRERDQAARFRFDEDRRAYVLAHGLRRQALSYELGAEPFALQFSADRHGKPLMSSPSLSLPSLSQQMLPIHFSHSHNRRAVAVAATHIGPIGVDIEGNEDVADGDGLLAPFVEYSDVQGFHAQWTALEAFWKADGKGLDGANPRIRLARCGERAEVFANAGSSRAVIYALELQDDCAAALALMQPHAQAVHHIEVFRLFNCGQERR